MLGQDICCSVVESSNIGKRFLVTCIFRVIYWVALLVKIHAYWQRASGGHLVGIGSHLEDVL